MVCQQKLLSLSVKTTAQALYWSGTKRTTNNGTEKSWSVIKTTNASMAFLKKATSAWSAGKGLDFQKILFGEIRIYITTGSYLRLSQIILARVGIEVSCLIRLLLPHVMRVLLRAYVPSIGTG